ncbi:helix-turn-helix transcriptional regulator [Clostridium perfringens]|uniref:helix-turn-helix domain-containing protein n=1 Tax=Clostridium perfringens TaxID=1502 RepID=UPI000DA3800F|nr:helix-turn-helix transcriptional regulator [Clostridium perfringens]EHK2427628.1 helix-turn-helix transcriptional regulator [Clostridium perfringens]MBO3394519.1 helix-turn-helix transcriptional regulator [Clostridium perfringens]MBO3401321.1 helix-turn-helix transcriptional regulator [Clostridium perfringens]MCX0363765.1 helix-turn-helix domain-containing protein [Clostridium perfringens]MDH2462154.1 helix-turn-helix transcriptional regulator [Clostridium perfringens]
MDFGTLVKTKRKEKKITLTDLAKQTDISVSYLSRLENGERTPIITIALKLAKILKISFKELSQCFNIEMDDEDKEDEKILIESKDYIAINSINNILYNIANGNTNLKSNLTLIFKQLLSLEKRPILLLASDSESTEIIKIKFYDSKIIEFLEDFFRDIKDNITIIEGNIIYNELGVEVYNLIDYLNIIEYTVEEGSYDCDINEFKNYLNKINY